LNHLIWISQDASILRRLRLAQRGLKAGAASSWPSPSGETEFLSKTRFLIGGRAHIEGGCTPPVFGYTTGPVQSRYAITVGSSTLSPTTPSRQIAAPTLYRNIHVAKPGPAQPGGTT